MLPLLPVAIGLPVLGICAVVAHVTGQDWPKLRNMFFFPLGGTTRGAHHATVRQRLLARLGGEQVRLVTRDQRAISAVWAEPTLPARAGVAVILLGANAMVLDDMVLYAEWYLRRARVPVLILNLWSYPDPVNPARPAALASAAMDGGAGADETAPLKQPPAPPSQAAEPLCATELTTYLDGEAAYAFLAESRQLRADGVLVHGVSIGGAVGASIALNHPGVRLTFDQPFCTLAEVTRHMTEGVVDGVVSRFLQSRGWTRTLRVTRACVAPPVSRAIAALLVRMCFKRGLGGAADGVALTDRFDNAGKAARIAGPIFVLFASEDEMMHPDAAQRILRARYGSGGEAPELRRHTAAIEGAHMAFFGEHEDACRAYLSYLRDTGFLPAANAAELAPALMA